MEPEGSSPHSQAHATCPYPELAPSSLHTHIPRSEDPFKYYPPIYAWVSPVVSFLLVSPPKPCTHLSPPPYALHAPPISFAQIIKETKISNLLVSRRFLCRKTPIFIIILIFLKYVEFSVVSFPHSSSV